jgi:hypothetical protein
MLTLDFATTAPIAIASQLSLSSWACAGQSLSVFARQKTGQNRVNVKQMIAVIRVIVALYQLVVPMSAALGGLKEG